MLVVADGAIHFGVTGIVFFDLNFKGLNNMMNLARRHLIGAVILSCILNQWVVHTSAASSSATSNDLLAQFSSFDKALEDCSIASYEQVVQAAYSNYEHSDKRIRAYALKLLAILIEKEAFTNYEADVQAAYKNLEHSDETVRAYALKLLAILVKKGAMTNYEADVQAAYKSCEDSDERVCANALKLLTILIDIGVFKNNCNYETDYQVALRNCEHPNEGIRTNAHALLSAIKKKKEEQTSSSSTCNLT